VALGAETPGDENRLLEAQRRLDTGANLHLVLAGIPPPVPLAGMTLIFSPAPSVRSSPSRRKVIRPALTSRCSAQ
jgi:hypothetical protein